MSHLKTTDHVENRTGRKVLAQFQRCTSRSRQECAYTEMQTWLPDVVGLLLLNEQTGTSITIASSIPEDCTSLHE